MKVLEISGSKDKLCVEGYAYEPLPSNALEGNIIKDSEMVAQCIKKPSLKQNLQRRLWR